MRNYNREFQKVNCKFKPGDQLIRNKLYNPPSNPKIWIILQSSIDSYTLSSKKNILNFLHGKLISGKISPSVIPKNFVEENYRKLTTAEKVLYGADPREISKIWDY